MYFVSGKTVLSQFPYPMTVTMVHLASIALFSTPLLKVILYTLYISREIDAHCSFVWQINT